MNKRLLWCTSVRLNHWAYLSPPYAVIPLGNNRVPQKKSSNMYIFHELEGRERAKERYLISFRNLKKTSWLYSSFPERSYRQESKGGKKAAKFSGSFQQQMDCGSSGDGGIWLESERFKEEAQRKRKH